MGLWAWCLLGDWWPNITMFERFLCSVVYYIQPFTILSLFSLKIVTNQVKCRVKKTHDVIDNNWSITGVADLIVVISDQ